MSTKYISFMAQILGTHCGRVDDFLAQERILARILIEQAPIHFDVPCVRVTGGSYRRHYPQPSVGIIKSARIVG